MTALSGTDLTARSSTPDDVPPLLVRSQERLSRLAIRAGDLRRRAGGARTGDRWLLVVGGTAMPLGLLLILLGWYGSAQTALPFEQTPYLISGGLLGLALVVGGGLLYFAYWLTLLVREGRAERERVAQHQDRLERVLTELVARMVLTTGPPAASAVERVVRTPSGTLLHRPSCAATRGLDVVDVAVAVPGLAACGLCQPALPPAGAGLPAPLAVTTPPARRARAPRATRTTR